MARSKIGQVVRDRIADLARNFKGKRLDEFGREVVSDLPMAPPVGYKKSPSLHEQIRDMVRSEKLRMEAEAAGMESFEEADDFDIPDDPIDPSTPYEADFEGGRVRDLKRKASDAAVLEAETLRKASVRSAENDESPEATLVGEPVGDKKKK